MIKTLFQLFFAFAKIGFTSFGGTSMIPLIMEEMLSHNWMNADDVANIVAIAEMTPGSLGVNCATFAGTQTAGVLGGTAAVIGVLTPTLTLTLAAALFFQKFRESKVMLYIMRAVKPICVGMIFAVLITLSGEYLLCRGHQLGGPWHWPALLLAPPQKRKWPSPRSSASRRCWGWFVLECCENSCPKRQNSVYYPRAQLHARERSFL